MLLYEPDATPLDLRFRLFGTYVRVHPLFWLITALLGSRASFANPVLPGNGLGDLALWVMCVFLSVLLHEFGHVWMGRLFGTHGHIVLHSMGGLAVGSNDLPHRWQRILVSAAGPAIQLVLFAVLLGVIIAMNVMPQPWLRGNDAVTLMLSDLLVINFFWPLLNLLPIWPLDGGMITREVCQGVAPRQGLVVSLWISLLFSGALAVNALMLGFNRQPLIPYVGWMLGGMWMGILFALFAVSSWQALQEETARHRRMWDDDVPWER